MILRGRFSVAGDRRELWWGKRGSYLGGKREGFMNATTGCGVGYIYFNIRLFLFPPPFNQVEHKGLLYVRTEETSGIGRLCVAAS